MKSKSPKLKLGVLNITICFDQPLKKSSNSKQQTNSPQKIQASPTFFPRYSSIRYKGNHPKIDNIFSPFIKYRNSHNESLRYYRQQQQAIRLNQQRLAQFSPINKTVQLKIDDKFEEDHQQSSNKPSSSPSGDNHLKLVFNKKHLRNGVDVYQQKNKNKGQLMFNIKTNPQDNLKTIFTVRPINTTGRKRHFTLQKKQKASKQIYKPSITRQQHRTIVASNIQQIDIKRIRPWSTSRNWQNKLGMQQSMMNDQQNQILID